MVQRLHQHSIDYMGDGFYRSKDPTNSIKVLKEHTENPINRKKYNKHTINTKHNKSIVCSNMGWLWDGSHRGQG